MNVIFKIQITEHYNLKCSIINTEGSEIIIKLKSDYPDEIDPSVLFEQNTIKITQKEEKSISFVKEWIENPKDFKTQLIYFNNKNYELLPEVLFALVILEYIRQIEREFIIENTIIEIPTTDKEVLQRIKISLEAINLKGINIEDVEIDYDYTIQGNNLQELIEKKQIVEEYQGLIEKAKCNAQTDDQRIKLEESQKRIHSEETFYQEMIKQFSTKERNSLNLCKLDNYCLFIASRYFVCIDDHINLIKVSKRMRLNMEKFHYNPISVYPQTIKFFPNIETLHLYKEEDEYLEGGRISKYVIWYPVSYNSTIKLKEENENNENEFKKIIWTKDDTNIQAKKEIDKIGYDEGLTISLIIPNGVKELTDNFLKDCGHFTTNLVIPSSVTSIPKTCVEKYTVLKELTIPINDSQLFLGNKIFKNNQHLEQDIYLPNFIYKINGNKIDFSSVSISIPTTFTSIDKNCFTNCGFLKELTIPSTIKSIPKECFIKCYYLSNISIPLNETRFICGNKIFSSPHVEELFYSPYSINVLNGKEIDFSKMILPTTVTSLDEECFMSCCLKMTELVIPETVIDIPMKTLMRIPYLKTLIIPSYYQLHGNRLFYIVENCLHSVHLPSSTEEVNNDYVNLLKTYTIPTNVTKLSDYCFASCEELTEIKGLEHVKEIGKGCFLNCPKLNQEEYPEVEKNTKEYINEVVKEQHQKQLEEWTSLKCSEIIFDSNIDNWNCHTSVFNERIIGKSKLVFLIETEDGEIFGYYLNTEVREEYHSLYGKIQQTNNETFHFNLQSQNNRLKEPMKFEIKKLKYGGIELYTKSYDVLIGLGDICLKKENYKNSSYCYQIEDKFDYHGIKNALCGKSSNYFFTTTRIVVIQMK